MTEKIIYEFLKTHNLLSPENTLIVGFSGGGDSLCLLDSLTKISIGFSIIAAHLNHNWRGIESQNEENTAKLYCESKNITFYSEIVPENAPHTELEARNRRYDFFNRAAKKFGATAIITGHTSDDNVETVLYRIIKGTGIIGLKGIPEVRYQKDNPPIYRPMLEISRKDTMSYCKANGLSPNFDSSNTNQKFARNKIRLSLIPELETYNSEAKTAVLRLSAIAEEEEDLINEYLGQIKSDVYNNEEELSTEKFVQLSKPVQKRMILDFLANKNIQYDYEKIHNILSFIRESSGLKSGNTMSLAKGYWIFASSVKIQIINETKAFCPQLDKTVEITPWSGGKPETFPRDTEYTVYADLSLIDGEITLRTRQPGDIIQPFGMLHKMKLKKYLINRGVPEFERDKLPLLAVGKEILWIAGVGTSELLRVKNIPTHVVQIV